MARHTFIVGGGRRLELQPSQTEPGALLVSLFHESRDLVGCVTVSASTAAVIAQAMAFEAVDAERRAEKQEDDFCECKAGQHVGRFKPPCTCHETRLTRFASGGPVLSALPVVDVAQVGA